MTEAYIGLGSNLGDRLGFIGRALAAIGELDETTVLGVSHAVESEPWGLTDQPAFANAVARVETAIPADRFLAALQEIESGLGRERAERNGPRVIDLDILLFGDDEWATPELSVPHPRMAERDFVVTPLLEVDPHVTYPDGTPVTRERATAGRVTGLLGPVPGFEDVTPARTLSGVAGQADGDPGRWVEVSAQTLNLRGGVVHAAGLLYDAAVLEDAGIPIAWDPMRPGDASSPYPLQARHRLLVPPAHARHAARILADVHSASMLPIPDGTPDGQGPEGGSPTD